MKHVVQPDQMICIPVSPNISYIVQHIPKSEMRLDAGNIDVVGFDVLCESLCVKDL